MPLQLNQTTTSLTGIQITTSSTFFIIIILHPPVYLGVFPLFQFQRQKYILKLKKIARANVLNNNCYYEAEKSFFSYAVINRWRYSNSSLIV